MKSIIGLYRAQALEFIRDRSSVLFVLLLPVVFGVFFGLIFSDSGSFTLQLGIANQDFGPLGASIAENLVSSKVDAIAVHAGSEDELLVELEKGNVHAVLVFPPGLTENYTSGQPTKVVAHFDASNPTSKDLAMGVIASLLDEINLSLTGSERMLEISVSSIQSNTLRSIDFYLPGMLGIALLWLGIFGTAQPVVTQRVSQIYRRIGITAISRVQILAAEVGWRMSVGLLQAVTFLVVGYLGYGVGVHSWSLFIPSMLIGTLVFVCLGYVLAGIGRTIESSMAIAQIVNFPMMMLSGSIMSADMLPGFFQPIVKALPLTYLSDLLRQAMVGAPGSYPIGLSFTVLGAWLIGAAILAVLLWKWE
jgi:ABC-2 type transport system permease protein